MYRTWKWILLNIFVNWLDYVVIYMHGMEGTQYSFHYRFFSEHQGLFSRYSTRSTECCNINYWSSWVWPGILKMKIEHHSTYRQTEQVYRRIMKFFDYHRDFRHLKKGFSEIESIALTESYCSRVQTWLECVNV